MKFCKGCMARAILLVAALGAAAPYALAQSYPNKTIRIMLPFSTGATDIVTRWLASKLAPVLGQAVVPEPRTGAGGNIAHEATAKNALDGSPGVIRPEAEEEGRAGAVLFQKLHQTRHPFPRAAVGIDIHFEGELHSTSRRASATCVR